jgi:hypothetical protein
MFDVESQVMMYTGWRSAELRVRTKQVKERKGELRRQWKIISHKNIQEFQFHVCTIILFC